jgi:hypothetical protein
MPNVNAEYHGVACADPREIVRELKLQRTKMDSLEVRVRSFRLSRRRATLGFVIVVSSTHAKIVTLMFALATLYGSVCSASCVAGVCPNFEHYSESHDCDQPGQHHSHGLDDHGQHGPDCKQHAHPPDFALNVSGIAPFQDQSVTALHPAILSALSNLFPTTQDIRQEFHRRLPGVPTNTLQQRAFVLRV